jgi:hypothetical protein
LLIGVGPSMTTPLAALSMPPPGGSPLEHLPPAAACSSDPFSKKWTIKKSIFQFLDNQDVHFSISGQSRFPCLYFLTIKLFVRSKA